MGATLKVFQSHCLSYSQVLGLSRRGHLVYAITILTVGKITSEITDYINGDGRERFSLPRLHSNIEGLSEWSEIVRPLERLCLPDRALLQIHRGLIRWAFLAQVVEEPAINTTRYRTRWGQRLSGDPRAASESASRDFLEASVSLLVSNLESQMARESLLSLLQNTQVPAEIPLDYAERLPSGIHAADNIEFIDLELLGRTAKLRKHLLKIETSETKAMKLLYDKVQVKSYLTDRVLTGAYKTNREYRWEVSPKSVHFAFKRNCVEIESKLVLSVVQMAGFSSEVKASLASELGSEMISDMTVCPITYEPLQYADLKRELIQPDHGKSSFQVGHLDPLKADGSHLAGNIAWVSNDGNRIQGDKSLDETREMVVRIYKSYERAGLLGS